MNSILAETFTPDLWIPSIRHFSLQFNLTDAVFEVVQRHASSLHGLDVHYLPPFPAGYHISRGSDICSQYAAPLPSSCPVFCGSPVLAPAYVPGSWVEDVCVSWYAEDRCLDDYATTLAFSLSKSRLPIKTIFYLSSGWNLQFMAEVAIHLPSLEVLELEADLGSYGPNEPVV